MSIWALLMLAVGLSMDALSVSVTIGITTRELRPRHALKTGLFFGGFQALMPLLGWLAGSTVSTYITAADHWIAFALLLFIGGKMLWDCFHADEGEAVDPTNTKRLLMLAVATSIDALAVGVSLAFLQVNILASSLFIGLVTFVICVAAVPLGRKLGGLFKRWATVAGALILIGIGVNILVTHLRKG